MRYNWSNGEGWIRSALIWTGLGLLFTVASEPPAFAIAICLVMGALSGWAEPMLVLRKYGRWTRFVVSLLGLMLVILSIIVLHGFLKGTAWFGLGALFTATSSFASAIFGARMCQRLNRQYEETAQMLRARYPQPKKELSMPEPAPAETRDAFLACLPDDLRKEAEGFFVTSLVAEPFRTIDQLPPSHSCLSGAAHLPPGHAWPERDGIPMEFLCQIRLQDVPTTPHRRPATGLLSFFVDVENIPWGHDENDAAGFRVLYFPDDARLQSTLRPGTGHHPPLRKPLRFVEVPEFIPSSDFEERFRDFLDQAGDERAEEADDLLETIQARNAGDVHRVLSRPMLVQYDMDDDLALAARSHGMPQDTHWTLLLQLDSDSDLQWSWGDAGRLYFWVPTEDLAVGRFDRCWLVLQSS